MDGLFGKTLSDEDADNLSSALKELEDIKKRKEFMEIDEERNNMIHLLQTTQDLFELNNAVTNALKTLQEAIKNAKENHIEC